MIRKLLWPLGLIGLIVVSGCKPRYESTLADASRGDDERFKVLSKAELLKSVIANGGLGTNRHDLINDMLSYAVNSKDDEVRQHVVSVLMSILGYYRIKEFEVVHTAGSNVSHNFEVGSSFGKENLLSYLTLKSSESTCDSNRPRTPKYCFDNVSCLNLMGHLMPFIIHDPEDSKEEVDAVINEVGLDIDCLNDNLRRDITKYRYQSLIAWKNFFRATNFGTAIDGEQPMARSRDELGRRQVATVRAQLEKLIREAVDPDAKMVRELFPEELHPQTLRDLAQERGAELNITYGPSFEVPSLDRLDRADFDTQRTVLGTVKLFNDAMTGAYISNVAILNLLDRLDKKDPSQWLKRISELSYAWTAAYARNKEPDGPYIYPKIAFKTLQMFSENEMRLPWAREWYQTMHTIYNQHIPTQLKEHELYAALSAADAQLSLAQTLVQIQLAGIGNGAENLVYHQKDMATRIEGFHSLFHMLGKFADAIDEYARAERAYRDARRDLTPEESADYQHPVNQAAMKASRTYQSIWLSFACLNALFGTGDQSIVLDPYKVEQHMEIGCWENPGFNWYIFARPPHNGVSPLQCISDNGVISLPKVCGIPRGQSTFSLEQVYGNVGQCFQQQDNFRWCQGNSDAFARRIADISAFVGAATATYIAGPGAGYLTRSALLALTVTATRRAVLSVAGVRPMRDWSQSWSDDWGKELAFTTGMIMLVQPLIAANAAIAGLSSDGGTGAAGISLSGAMRFIGFHSLNVAAFTLVSYATPQIAAQIYGRSPSELGADIPLKDRVIDAALFELIFGAYHAGQLAVIHREALRAQAVEVANRSRDFFGGHGARKIPGLPGKIAELKNPALQGMIEYYERNGMLNFDIYAVLGRGGGRRATRDELLGLAKSLNAERRINPELLTLIKGVLRDERAFAIYESMRGASIQNMSIASGKGVASDFYAVVNTVLRNNGNQPLIPNGRALTPAQLTEVTGVLKTRIQSINIRRQTPEIRKNDRLRNELDHELAQVEEALSKLPNLANANFKPQFDADYLAQPAGSISASLEASGSSLFKSLLMRSYTGGSR